MQQTLGFISRYWKFILLGIGIALIVSVVIVSLVVGTLGGIIISHPSQALNDNQRQELTDKVNVVGEWIYVAETNDSDIVFSEDGCKRRLGTVNIEQVEGTEIKLYAERKLKQGCKNQKVQNPEAEQQKIKWASEVATILPRLKTVFTWIKTEDEFTKYAYIRLEIIDKNNIKPTKMTGVMYYLAEETKKWFKSKVSFYKFGSEDARAIENEYNVKLQ